MEHGVMDGGPYIHGTKLAPNIDELLYRWSEIGFVDFYDWSQCVGEDGIDLEISAFNLIRKGINEPQKTFKRDFMLLKVFSLPSAEQMGMAESNHV